MDTKRSHDEHTVIIEIPGITGASSVKKCPHCGAYINPRDGRCRSCGKTVESSTKVGGFSKCPVCDGFISKKEGVCRTCGYKEERKEEEDNLPRVPSTAPASPPASAASAVSHTGVGEGKAASFSTAPKAPPPPPQSPGGTKVKCGGCGKILLVTSPKRPIKVKCSNCGAILQLN